jgi:hypothetical protein
VVERTEWPTTAAAAAADDDDGDDEQRRWQRTRAQHWWVHDHYPTEWQRRRSTPSSGLLVADADDDGGGAALAHDLSTADVLWRHHQRGVDRDEVLDGSGGPDSSVVATVAHWVGWWGTRHALDAASNLSVMSDRLVDADRSVVAPFDAASPQRAAVDRLLPRSTSAASGDGSSQQSATSGGGDGGSQQSATSGGGDGGSQQSAASGGGGSPGTVAAPTTDWSRLRQRWPASRPPTAQRRGVVHWSERRWVPCPGKRVVVTTTTQPPTVGRKRTLSVGSTTAADAGDGDGVEGGRVATLTAAHLEVLAVTHGRGVRSDGGGAAATWSLPLPCARFSSVPLRPESERPAAATALPTASSGSRAKRPAARGCWSTAAPPPLAASLPAAIRPWQPPSVWVAAARPPMARPTTGTTTGTARRAVAGGVVRRPVRSGGGPPRPRPPAAAATPSVGKKPDGQTGFRFHAAAPPPP